jgi:hypothetical protein
MDLRADAVRTPTVKLLAIALAAAAVAVPTALAKGRLVVHVGDATPRVGQSFVVTVRTDYVVPPNDWLRLVLVPPGKSWYAYAARDGIHMTRTSATSWRAVVRLNRPGRWRLVIPNGTHVGYLVPPPAEWMPWVQVRP